MSSRRLKQFWEYVNKTDNCWEWTGYILSSGYGQFKIACKNYRAHRIAYALSFGQPMGIVMHTCDNRCCCNPKHLRDGTNAENSADMVAKGRVFKPIGELHPNRKLTCHKANMIRMSTGTCIIVGKQFGVSASLVSMIRTGKAWNAKSNS
ncbi:MAG: HNH endonuclease signature motif containing protein [Candidatus Thorarchaeota archaeon]|jgi:hypothetical protein